MVDEPRLYKYVFEYPNITDFEPITLYYTDAPNLYKAIWRVGFDGSNYAAHKVEYLSYIWDLIEDKKVNKEPHLKEYELMMCIHNIREV